MNAIRFLLGSIVWAYVDAASAAIEFRPETETGSSFIAWGMLGVLACAGGALVWARKKGGLKGMPGWAARRSHVQVLSGTPVGAGARLVEVRYRGRILLLGVTSAQIHLIEAHEDPLREEGSS